MRKNPAEIAQHDQWLATIESMASMWNEVTMAFIRAGYSRDEAIEMTLFFLESSGHGPH